MEEWVHSRVAKFAIPNVLQQIPFTRRECNFSINYMRDLRGGRSLDRRIFLAIFQNQKRSGNDKRDHEGWS